LGCTNENINNNASITFEQLFSNPSHYNGGKISIEGFIYLGFEIRVLSEELKESGHAEGHLIPGKRMIWIEGDVPIEIYDRLHEQHMMGPSEKYGKVLITGNYQHGKQYGHLGAYERQISLSQIRLLSWSPPK
jgi:hypothetical protein